MKLRFLCLLLISFYTLKADAKNIGLAMQASDDGTIIVASMPHESGANNRSVYLAKLLPTGVEDLTFGSKGRVYLPLTQGVSIFGLRRVKDGKIFVFGADKNSQPIIYAFHSNGQVDLNFGHKGAVTFSGIRDLNWYVSDLDQLSDGRLIVAVGNILCLLPNGQIDYTWSTMGHFAARDAHHLKVLDSGQIAISGQFHGPGGIFSRLGLVRLNPDGLVDASYGWGGVAGSTVLRLAGSFIFDSEGRLYLEMEGNHDAFINRYDNNGILDESFKYQRGDSTRRDFGLFKNIHDKILTIGVYGREWKYKISSFNPDGSVDSTFSADLELPYRSLRRPDAKVFEDGSSLWFFPGHDKDSFIRLDESGKVMQKFAIPNEVAPL